MPTGRQAAKQRTNKQRTKTTRRPNVKPSTERQAAQPAHKTTTECEAANRAARQASFTAASMREFSASTYGSSVYVRRLTMTATRRLRRKPGTISYIFALRKSTLAHTKTVTAPVTSPASAPVGVSFLQ